jgi:transposase
VHAGKRSNLWRRDMPEEPWNQVERLLRPPKPRWFRFPRRKPVDDRKLLIGIVFVLQTDIRWEDLRQGMGSGSSMTGWRRLHEWQTDGVWQQLHELLLSELQPGDRIDWSRAVVDFSLLCASGGGEETGSNPTDRSKPGSGHQLIPSRSGISLAAMVTGGYACRVNELEPLLDAVPPVHGKRGRPRRRPRAAYAGRSYDSEPNRHRLRWRGTWPCIARRHTSRGICRIVVSFSLYVRIP